MREYPLTTLNMIEYARIYLKKFWMCLMQYIHKATVQITEQLSKQRRIQNTVKHLLLSA